MATTWEFRLDFQDIDGGEEELFDAISAKLAEYKPQLRPGERAILTVKATKVKV